METPIIGNQKWRERRSLSAPFPKISSRTSLFPISTQHLHRRSLGDTCSPHHQLRVSLLSDVLQDGYSTCGPSPISPATPRSAVLGKDQLELAPLSVL
ncbi:hypothetical protein C8J57DRAFT_1516578 [Mycena rebaudengoi]|nr:hypothetical protein C8J57DRAFT_1516578 [Mycena rebaudengoi]